jgi:hypothetical protein
MDGNENLRSTSLWANAPGEGETLHKTTVEDVASTNQSWLTVIYIMSVRSKFLAVLSVIPPAIKLIYIA